MAYVDYDFYTESYYGSVVPEADFERLADRASDYIDTITFDRLADGLPADRKSLKRLKKAACAVLEKLYELELAEKNAAEQASASLTDTSHGGKTTGIITSVTAGKEAISYATPQQIGAGAKEWSAVYEAAGNVQKTNDLLLKTALPLLMGVRTDDGIPILYAGV